MKIKNAYLLVALFVVLLPVSVSAEPLILGGPDSRSVTDSVTRRASEEGVSGDIYRGTVLGAEKKAYSGAVVLGERPIPTKKKMYDTSLIHAIKADDVDRVRTLLYANVDVEETNFAGLTPLTVAAEKGNLKILQLLVERGQADLNTKSNYGITPLIAAASAGNGAAAVYLINHGADVTAQDDLGKTALLYASKFNEPEMIDLLAQASKESIDFADSEGNTPLIYSAQRGFLANVKHLLANGANVNYINPNTGLSALSAAAAEGHIPVVKWLVKKAKVDVNMPDTTGRSPIFYAIEQNQPAAISTLLSSGADPNQQDLEGTSPLMHAAALTRPECMQILLKQKRIDTRAQDNYGRNAVTYSAYAQNDLPAQLLIQARAEIDIPDMDGNTPLMHAIQNQNDAIAQLFLQQGANPNRSNKEGETPATLANQFLPPSSSTSRLLLRGGVPQQQRS